MKKVSIYLIVLAVNILWFINCGPSILPAKGGSEVWGKVVDENGVAVGDAELILCQIAADDSLLPNDTFVTSSSGEYRFTDVASGHYAIQGDQKSRSLVVLRTDIFHDTGIAALGIDTMKAPGAVLCVFTGADDGELLGAPAFIPKSSYHGFIDNDTLEISGIYPGVYTLKCALKPYGYLPVVIDTLKIRSAGTTVLQVDLQRDTSGAPPFPQNLLVISYDTLHGIATLRWNAVHVNDLDGYYVYSGLSKDSLGTRSALTKDTTYALPVTTDSAGSVVVSYVLVKSADLRTEQSSPSNVITIEAPSPKSVKTGILDTLIKSDGPLYHGDTVTVAVSFRNQTRLIDSVVWALGRPDSVVKISRFDTVHSGEDSLKIIWGDQTEQMVYISVHDNSGSVFTSERKLTGSGMYPPGTWKVFSGKLPNASQFLTAVTIDSFIYTLGGRGMWWDSINEYDQLKVFDNIGSFSPGKNAPGTVGSMVAPRNMHASVAYDGKIYSIGGSPGFGTEDLFTIEMYDPQTNRSEVVYTMAESRVGVAACVVGSKMLIIGGRINNTVTGAIDVYDLSTGAWYNIGSLSVPRSNHAAVVCGNVVYVAGGIGMSAADVLAETESIDPSTGECILCESMIQKRSKFSAVSVGSRIYVFGGYISESNIETSVEMLDCSKPSPVWTSAGSMSSARYGTAAAVHNGKIFIIGGALGRGKNPVYSSLIEVYYP